MTILKNITFAFLGLATGYLGGHLAVRQNSAAMDMPVVVLDVQQFVNQAITGPNGEMTPDGVEEGILRAKKEARKFAEAGYLVVERRGILDGPSQYFVSPKQVEKNANGKD